MNDLYVTNPWNSRIQDGIERIKKELNSYTLDYKNP